MSTFQKIAPMSPAKISPIETTSGLTILAISLATVSGRMRNAMKFQNAAHNTAWNGLSTRVATIVAIEFAASWNPLTKSNRRAMSTTA